jgi:protein SCO1/2
MSTKPPRTERLVWVGLGLTTALLLLASWLAVLKVRAGFGKPLPVYGQVADFQLTNQDGRPVTLAELRGQVWVADIIFTRCAGPCLKMSRQMLDLQQGLPAGSAVKLISLTTDPDFDSPSILKKYSERFSANPKRWWFLTGTKAQIASLAIDSLKLTAIEKKAEERQSAADLFVHSTIFVLVDKRGQLRGVYETNGEGTDPGQVRSQLLAGIRRLEHEG